MNRVRSFLRWCLGLKGCRYCGKHTCNPNDCMFLKLYMDRDRDDA